MIANISAFRANKNKQVFFYHTAQSSNRVISSRLSAKIEALPAHVRVVRGDRDPDAASTRDFDYSELLGGDENGS